MPQIKFDFFSVKVPEHAPMSFSEALRQIETMPTDSSRCEIDGTTCLFVRSLNPSVRYHACLFTNVRMDALPSRTKVSGERTSLDLEDDEGLGEDVVIAYNESLNIVSVQRNRFSLSSNAIIKFINSVFPDLQVHFSPVIRGDALQRFARCDTLKKLRLRLAGTDDLSFLQDSDLSTNTKITLQEILTEPYVDITFSVGRKNAGLTKKIENIAMYFTNLHRTGGSTSEIVKTIEVSGYEEGESASVLIDLLQDRLIHVGEVAMENRMVNTDQLMRVACEAIASNYEELTRYAS